MQVLADLAEMPLLHSPADVHTELVDVMKGERKPTRTADGWKSIGYTWTDSVDSLIHGTSVTSKLNTLKAVAETWSADVTHRIREREHSETVARERQEAEDNGENYKPDTTPASSTHIEERSENPLDLARELGAATAAGSKAAVEQGLRRSGYIR